jgi:hypothetical protein
MIPVLMWWTAPAPGDELPLDQFDKKAPLYFQTDFLWSILFRAFSENPGRDRIRTGPIEIPNAEVVGIRFLPLSNRSKRQ